MNKNGFVKSRICYLTLASILLALLFTGMACQNQGTATPEATSTPWPTLLPTPIPSPCLPDLVSLPFDTLPQKDFIEAYNYGGSEEGLILAVIDAPQDIEPLKGYLHSDEIPKAMETVDFQEEFAILLARGVEPTSNYEVHIDHVLVDGAVLNLCATFEYPREGELVTEMFTHPYHLIRLRRSDFPFQPVTVQLIVNRQIIASTSDTIAFERADDIGFWVVEQRDHPAAPYGSKEPGLLVIASQQELQQIQDYISEETVQTLKERLDDPYPLLVLVFFMGNKPSDGYGIWVDGVTFDGEKFTVNVLLTERVPLLKRNDIETSPYALMVISSPAWEESWESIPLIEISANGQVIVTNQP